MSRNNPKPDPAAQPHTGKSPRLISLDTMRGFTMFWIIGGAQLISSLQSFGPSRITEFLAYQMDHSTWEGLRFYDCIWPGFMLMVGVSIPFAYAKRSLTQPYPLILRHAVRRFAILFLLGSLRESVGLDHPHLIELSSALQPIAVAYLVSFLLVRKTWKFQAVTAVLILVIYGFVQALVPVPGVGPGSYSQNANLVWYIDSILLRHRTADAVFLEGWGTTLTMIPPISTTILGLLMGQLLRSQHSQATKLKLLAITCGGILATGFVVSRFIPVVMKMWTVSYGLLSAGWACSVLLLLYWIIDVHEIRKWTLPFVVIGMNALAIYLSSSVMRLSAIAEVFTRVPATVMGPAGPLFSEVFYIALEWIILYWMYKRKIFLTP